MNTWQKWMLAVLVALMVVPFAEAKGSPSFKGGFSSYKSPSKTSYKSSPKPEKPNKQFGSFQKSTATDTSKPANGSSADLTQASAKQNAWNSYQAAQQKKLNDVNKPNAGNSTAWGGGNGNNGGNNAGWSRSDYGSNKNNKNQTGSNNGWNQQPVHHTTVVNNGGGFMQGLLWFMVGQSWGSHHNNAANYPQNASAQTTETGVAEGQPHLTDREQSPAVQEPEKQEESFVWGVLRLILWVGFLWGVIVVIKKVIAAKNFVQSKRYSLRSF